MKIRANGFIVFVPKYACLLDFLILLFCFCIAMHACKFLISPGSKGLLSKPGGRVFLNRTFLSTSSLDIWLGVRLCRS